MNLGMFKKLAHGRIWRRIFMERLTEPLHINAMSGAVALFGSYRARVAHDLVIRPGNAWAILNSADQAKELGVKTVTLVEFGVAAGAGLLNMSYIAARVTQATGVAFRLYGFDTGKGMPPSADYRDHPDLYQEGDFKMDVERLRAALPANTKLIIGDIGETAPSFIKELSLDAPIGYVSVDVDYYSSTKQALKLFAHDDPRKYLPVTTVYFDDVCHERHNSWCGELLAISEFNAEHALRKLERHAFLRGTRIYRRAEWIDHMWTMHALDHPHRQVPYYKELRNLENPYL